MAMTPEQLISFTELFYSNNIALMKNKNADYGAGVDDAHQNFKMLEMISGMENSTEIGFLTRMLDKMARVISFVRKGALKVPNESVTDSLKDLANYSALFAAYLSDKQEEYEVKMPKGTPFIPQKDQNYFNKGNP